MKNGLVGRMVWTLAVVALCAGCEPKDEALMKSGEKLQLLGKYSEAKEKYAGAAALGNAEAFRKLADLKISHDFTVLRPDDASDYVSGHDRWLAMAAEIVDEAGVLYEKAKIAGYEGDLTPSLEKLRQCEAMIAETTGKVDQAKVAEKKRLEQERVKKEAEEKAAREEAERKAAEAKRQKEAEEKAAREEAERKAAEAKRREEEEKLRESPEYCMEHDLALPSRAMRVVCSELTYSSNTGNKIYDEQETARHHARFRGKTLIVAGTVDKVEKTFFTDEVKIIVSVSGGTISARFDGMSEREAANIRTGQSIQFKGRVSDRPVLSTFAMDGCRMQ